MCGLVVRVRPRYGHPEKKPTSLTAWPLRGLEEHTRARESSRAVEAEDGDAFEPLAQGSLGTLRPEACKRQRAAFSCRSHPEAFAGRSSTFRRRKGDSRPSTPIA